MPSMLELQEEISRVLSLMADDDDPVAQEEALQYLDSLGQMEAEKADAIGYALRKMKAETEFLRGESARLIERATRREQAVDQLKARVLAVMQLSGLTKVKGAASTIYTSTTTSVAISGDPELLPAAYLRTKFQVDPDKKALLAALKAGQEIPGAALVTRETLCLR